jgi:hypothetical protein
MVDHKDYYKGEGGGFLVVEVVVSLVSPCMPVVRLCTKNAPTTHILTCCLVCVNPCYFMCTFKFQL